MQSRNCWWPARALSRALRRHSTILALAALSGPALAADGVLAISGSYGRPLTVGQVADVREEWTPASLDAPGLVSAFKSICIDDSVELAGFARAEQSLPADGKAGPTSATVMQAPGVEIAIWDDEPSTLKGRASVIRDRGVIVTGPITDRNIFPGQCSLSAKAVGVTGEGLAQAMTQAFGAGVKLVVKPGFADGNWQITGADGSRSRLAFYAVDLKKPDQLIHISIIPERAAK